MGFLGPEYQTIDEEHGFHYRSECAACPLKGEYGSDMKAVGSNTPHVYILGEAPGQEEVRQRRPFVGPAGEQLRKYIPQEWLPHLRWNNCVRTRPPENRDPTAIELACCRQSVEKDIEATKPKAIFGFGAVALHWAIRRSGITAWSGRHLPIKVGNHTCWFFPIIHPSYVLHRKPEKDLPSYLYENRFRSDIDHIFSRHVRRAFSMVDHLPHPLVHTVDHAFKDVDFDMRCNDDALERIRRFVSSLYDDEPVGLDLETNALRPYNKSSKILTVAMSGARGTLAWPMRHRQAKWSKTHLAELDTILRDFLIHAPCRKVAHNAPFEQEWFAVMYGVDCLRAAGSWGCSMGQAFILDSRIAHLSGGGPLSLAFLTHQHFGLDIKTLSNLDVTNLDEEDLDNVLRYNCPDSVYARLLHIKQDKLLREQGLEDVYEEHLRRITTTTLTGVKGIPVDLSVTDKLMTKYERQKEAAWKELNQVSIVKHFTDAKNRAFNPLATADVKACLARLPDKLVKPARDMEGELSSVDEEALKKIKHPFSAKVLKYKKILKVIGTYIKPYRDHVFEDGLVHPQTKVASTRTWRTSAADFNYQNQPKRDEGRRDVRAQVRKDGYKVVSFDYAQIQARNIAMESLDEALVKSFKERYDIHSDWVERIARVHPAWVKEGVKALAHDKAVFKKYRSSVKQEFVFSSFFGAKSKTIGFYLKCDERIARKLHEDLWQMFPGIPIWHRSLERMYMKRGYVTGHSRFRRHGPMSHNELINAPIQADEAMIVLDAMTRLSEMGWVYQANMEIHDDLSFLWPAAKVEERIPQVLNVMLKVPYPWANVVPIGVEVSVGDDWFKQDQVGEFFSDTWKD